MGANSLRDALAASQELKRRVQWVYAPGRIREYLKGTTVGFMARDMAERREMLNNERIEAALGESFTQKSDEATRLFWTPPAGGE